MLFQNFFNCCKLSNFKLVDLMNWKVNFKSFLMNLSWFIYLNHNYILLTLILIYSSSSFLIDFTLPTLHCDEAPKWSDHYSFKHDPEMFHDFLDTLSDEDYDKWNQWLEGCLSDEEDDSGNEDEVWLNLISDYRQYRFNLFKDSLTLEEKYAYLERDINKTRFWGIVFIIIMIILGGGDD